MPIFQKDLPILTPVNISTNFLGILYFHDEGLAL